MYTTLHRLIICQEKLFLLGTKTASRSPGFYPNSRPLSACVHRDRVTRWSATFTLGDENDRFRSDLLEEPEV